MNQQHIDILKRTLVKKKTFACLSVGMQKLITDYIGVRAVVNWENTAAFGSLKPQENPTGIVTAKPKNAFAAGVGIFVKF